MNNQSKLIIGSVLATLMIVFCGYSSYVFYAAISNPLVIWFTLSAFLLMDSIKYLYSLFTNKNNEQKENDIND